jgi:hypothetical protein
MAAAEVLKVAHGAFHDDERAMGDDNTVEAVDVRLEVTDHIMDGYVDWDGAHLVTRISRAFLLTCFTVRYRTGKQRTSTSSKRSG